MRKMPELDPALREAGAAPLPRGPGRRSEFFPVHQRRPVADRWPAADQAAWRRATSAGEGPLDEPGGAAHLAHHSKVVREAAYGNFLAWLEAQGLLDHAAGPAERLRPEWASGWLAAVCTRVSPRTAQQLLLDLALVARVMLPDRDWAWLRRLPERPTYAEIRRSRTPRAPPPDTVRIAIGALGLCDAAGRLPASLAGALRYRDGLIIALSAYHAVRLRNLAEIRLGQHLLQQPEGGWHLAFTTTKNKAVVEAPLSVELAPYLERYLERHRPVLLGGRADHGFLWVNADRQPLGSSAFRLVFRQVGESLGVAGLHPHAMRHGLATGLLRRDPRHLQTAALALGHRGTGSVNAVYDRSGAAVAQGVWCTVLRATQKRR